MLTNSLSPVVERQPRRGVMVAMVLGTALSTLGPSSVSAATLLARPETVDNISRYCTACWRNARLPADCWTDCTQDVFVRLLERVAPEAWDRVLNADSDERREFLRAIDAVKKRVQRSRKGSVLTDDLAADRSQEAEQRRSADRQSVTQAASELLSLRQQRILQLSFEGWSVQEIATELQTPVERVSDEKYKAVRKLRQHLCAEDCG